MMDREDYYDDDIDTMTDEADDEALNPDYDRVSGSGAMPSLDDFLGVDHSSDGLGASSDPFGNVVGDPIFSEDHLNEQEAGDGFGSYGRDAGYDSDNFSTDTEDKEPEDVKFSFKSVMDGSYMRIKVSRNFRLIVVLIVMALLHIANRDLAESLIRTELHLHSDVHNLRATSIDVAAKLMSISKVTEVANLVGKRKLNIRKTQIPPMQFVIDKFERADSLTKDEPTYQQGALYDDGYEMYSR